MKTDEVFCNTFQSLRHRLGHDRPRDGRSMWQVRQSPDSDFCRAMVGCGYLTREQMERAARRYRLGRSRDGGVIFWQMDRLGQVYDGKIMHYRPDGHRDHERHPDWVSSCLKRHYLKGDERLAAEIAVQHCLFGTHLLSLECRVESLEFATAVPSALESSAFSSAVANSKLYTLNSTLSSLNSPLPVAVVEAEKTAVIMSEHFPDCLWLAAGGLYELTVAKLFPLRGRRIVLFPDTDPDGRAYATWYRVMLEAQRLLGHAVHLSPLLEQRATPAQKQRKIDIADFIFED